MNILKVPSPYPVYLYFTMAEFLIEKSSIIVSAFWFFLFFFTNPQLFSWRGSHVFSPKHFNYISEKEEIGWTGSEIMFGDKFGKSGTSLCVQFFLSCLIKYFYWFYALFWPYLLNYNFIEDRFWILFSFHLHSHGENGQFTGHNEELRSCLSHP